MIVGSSLARSRGVVWAAINLALAAYMTGIGWAMHAVHYPLFAGVSGPGWAAYHAVVNAVLAMGMLALTATVFGRLHRALQPFDDSAHGRLMSWNAARVAGWTAQMLVAVAIVISA